MDGVIFSGILLGVFLVGVVIWLIVGIRSYLKEFSRPREASVDHERERQIQYTFSKKNPRLFEAVKVDKDFMECLDLACTGPVSRYKDQLFKDRLRELADASRPVSGK